MVIFCVFFAGCSGPIQVFDILAGNAVPMVPTADELCVVNGSNEFTFALYNELRKDPANQDANLFISPFSVSSAMAIVYEGARAETADEIRSVFHFPQNDTIRRQGFSGITTLMNRETQGNVLRTANALWAEKTFPFRTDYIETAHRYYAAEVTNLDFINEPEHSRHTINAWVMDRTEDRIPELVPERAIKTDTRLVITNAVYFKGQWETSFKPENTREMDFRITPNSTVRVPMMVRGSEGVLSRTTYTQDIQVLALPYRPENGRNLSMIIIMPREDDLSVVEDQLNAPMLSETMSQLKYREVNIQIPRFQIATEYRLKKPLENLGMPVAFTMDADFSGMDGMGVLYIDTIFHKAFVKVNEEGTEAAAATAIKVVLVSAKSVFTVDHPFVFLIIEERSGNILFIGRIVNPNA